jgi:hypothetical protein
MKTSNFFRRGVVIAAASICVIIFACKKNDDNVPQLRTQEYSLSAVGASKVTGKVTVTENADKSFNVKVALDSSAKDTVHLMNIHNGSIASPGDIAIPLNSITGTGAAATGETQNIKTAMQGDVTVPLTYDSILVYNGYLNVYYSAARADSLIARANIGKNK